MPAIPPEALGRRELTDAGKRGSMRFRATPQLPECITCGVRTDEPCSYWQCPWKRHA